MCLSIDVIADNRDNLLLLEIAAFIHDIGKLSEEFLSFNSTLSTKLVEGHYLILHRPEQRFYGCQFLHDNNESSATIISLDCLKQLLAEIRTQYTQWKSTNPFPLSYNARKNQKNRILNQVFKKLTPQFSDDVRKEFSILLESGFIAEDFLPKEFMKLLNTLSLDLPPPLNDMDFFAGDILERHDEGYESHIQQRLPKNNKTAQISLVVNRFRDCDKRDSGADKGKIDEKIDKVRQDGNICISTAFGEETELIPRSKLKQMRYDFSNQLTRMFKKIWGKTLCKEDWYYLLYQFRKEAFASFSKALGETRRGANDVTLWDHSYSAASLFKSLLAQILIENEFLKRNPGTEIKEELKRRWEAKEGRKPLWRILRVNIDSLGLLSKAHKIGDILGYQQAIYGRPNRRMDGLLNAIKKVVEVDYPLGNEVYRDESGIYFTFPDLKEPSWQSRVLEEIRSKIYALNEVQEFDVEPLIALSEPSSFLTIIGKEIEKGYEQIANFSTQNYPQWVSIWQDWQKDSEAFFRTKIKSKRWCKKTCPYNDCLHKGGKRQYQIERCVVCGIRPKCEHQEVCSSCEKRRLSRLGYWLGESHKKRGNTPTIWLSEIADINGRVAIIAGVFEMSKWLNGEYVESTFTQSPVLYDDYEDYPTAQASNFLWFRKNLKLKDFKDYKELDFRRLLTHHKAPNRWEQEIFLHFSKHPSPARLRRIWETTQQFFKETVVDIIDGYGYKNVGMRTKRLTLTPTIQPPNPRDATLSIRGMRVDSYWFGGKRKQFLVTENLDWLASQLGVTSMEELETALRIPIVVRLPQKVGGEGMEEKYPMDATSCQDERFQNYKPYTIIHTSPLSFIAIVPCVDTMGILEKIRNEYENQFSKVANRLPLSLGAIFFPKRLPLYVALDATRRMMERFRQPAKEEKWIVLKKEPKEEEKRVVLTLKNGEHPDGIGSERILKVSYKLMETSKEDVYHPYFFLVKPTDGHPTEGRRSYFPALGRFPHPLVHVKEIFEGDIVQILPSYFDFEFIDASEKGFLISYGADGNRRRQLANAFSGKRPYYLHEIDKLKKIWTLLSDERGLTQNQIRNVSQTLLEKLEGWNLNWEEAAKCEVFKKFVLNLLRVSDHGNFWKRLKEEGTQDLMLQACQNGVFFDALYLYQTVMKEKPKRKD